MAAKITHIEVLRQTLTLLEHGERSQRIMARFLKRGKIGRYAFLGAIAPDIFYYYHILSRQKNRQALAWGDRAHHQKVMELVLAWLDMIREDGPGPGRDKRVAFVLGYVCHCAVDIVTHPYIFYITGNYYAPDKAERTAAQENHLRVEYALDSYLVQTRWGMGPNEYDFMQYVDCRRPGPDGKPQLDPDVWKLWVGGLRRVFPAGFDHEYVGSHEQIEKGDIVNESYLGFLKFNNVLDTRNMAIRLTMRAVDLLTLRKVKMRNLILPPRARIDPRLPNEDHREWKYPVDPAQTSSESFMDLVHRAARASAVVMNEAWLYLEGKGKRKDFEKKYSGYNLDTGVRSSSLDMKEFAPIPEDD